MPYVIAKRTDLQNGAIQIKDLYFNKSQANPVTEPFPQGPLYVRKPDLNTTGSTAPVINAVGNIRSFLRATHGLLAYILVYVDNDGIALTKAQGINIVNAIQTAIVDGNALDIGTIVTNVDANYDFNGSVEDVLRILSGDQMNFSAGLKIQDTNGDYVANLGVGTFTTPNDRKMLNGDTTWETSLESGNLADLVALTTYAGTTQKDGANNLIGLVTVYDDDGTLLS